MLPASTSIAKGRITFGSRLLRFFQVRIRFAGYPNNTSTGEIFAFAAPKLKMAVNIRVLANPHNPLTKYAVKAAINHKIMTEFSASFKYILIERVVEKYRQRFGHYPERILTDKIFRSNPVEEICFEVHLFFQWCLLRQKRYTEGNL